MTMISRKMFLVHYHYPFLHGTYTKGVIRVMLFNNTLRKPNWEEIAKRKLKKQLNKDVTIEKVLEETFGFNEIKGELA